MSSAREMILRCARQREYGIAALILAAVLSVLAANGDLRFLEADNLIDILVNCAPVLIVACGVMLVIVTGEIDISVGSLSGLLAALAARLVSDSQLALHPALGVLAVLLAGTAAGLFTGVLVTFGRVPSIIATLGMLTALRGVTVMVLDGKSIADFPDAFTVLGTGRWLGLPISVWIAISVVLFTAVIIHRTAVGRRIFALGSNGNSARMLGLPGRRLKLIAFGYTGFLTGLATILTVARLGNVAPSDGTGLELLVVTCVVVGGVSISGGTGRLRGVVLAVILLVMMRTVLTFIGLGPEATKWERAIQGGFILMAVIVDHVVKPRGQGARKVIH